MTSRGRRLELTGWACLAFFGDVLKVLAQTGIVRLHVRRQRVDYEIMLPPFIVSQFEQALLRDGLRELALSLAADGLQQVEVYCRFADFHDYLVRSGRESDAEGVGAALEMIVGSCATRWFDNILSSFEIQAFESGVAQEDIARMCDIIQGMWPCWIPHKYAKQSEHLVEVTVMVIARGAFARELHLGFERVGDNWRLQKGVDG